MIRLIQSALAGLVVPMDNLLALDQASIITGWSVFKDEKLIAHGIFNNTQKDFGERLEAIRDEILGLIQKYEITEVSFEDIQLQEEGRGATVGNVQTFKKLAEVFGVVEELLAEQAIPHQAIPSTSWKSGLKIAGRHRPEQKENCAKYIQSLYEGETFTQDECDSIAIGLYTIKQRRENINNWA